MKGKSTVAEKGLRTEIFSSFLKTIIQWTPQKNKVKKTEKREHLPPGTPQNTTTNYSKIEVRYISGVFL